MKAEGEAVHQVQVAKFVIVQLPCRIEKGLAEIRRAHVVEIAVGRQMHADPSDRPHRKNSPYYFIEESKAILQAATVAIGSMIGSGLQKLVNQIAIGPMNFNPIEPSPFRSVGGQAIVLYNERE